MSTEETIYYDEDGIKITSARAVLGGKTYALSGITSVSEGATAPSIVGPLLLFTGGLISVAWAVGNNNSIIGWLLAVVLVGLAVFVYRGAKSTHIVRIASAGGESNAYSSTNKEQVNKIVSAINTAIIRRG